MEFDIIEGLGYSRCDTVFLPERSGKLGEWVHVSFTARPMNAEDGCPPKLFFAEMYDIGPANEYSLSMCCILEPNDPGNTFLHFSHVYTN